jgi:hypothetical protein
MEAFYLAVLFRTVWGVSSMRNTAFLKEGFNNLGDKFSSLVCPYFLYNERRSFEDLLKEIYCINCICRFV